MVAGVFLMNDDAYRAAVARWVLRRIRRRQEALRRRWYELTREEVGAELLAIGRELVDAAPLFLPRAFDSGGKAAGSDHGKAPSRNGHYDGPAEQTGLRPVRDPSEFREAQPRRWENPEVWSPENERREALIGVGERLLDELDRLVKELGDGEPEVQASS